MELVAKKAFRPSSKSLFAIKPQGIGVSIATGLMAFTLMK
jgi:hypothetical protein